MNSVVKIHAKEESSLIFVLNKLMTNCGVNINQLSRNTGLSNTTIKRICIDPDCNPTLSSVTKIAEFFSITPNQLIGIEPLTTDQQTYQPNLSSWTNIPILELNQTINWPSNIEEIRESTATIYVKTDIDPKESLFAVIVRDESLEPKFSEGTILIFDSSRELRNKDYVLLLDNDKPIPQFRQLLTDGPDVYARTINQNLANNPPSLLKKDQSKILGTLIQARSTFPD